MSLDRETWIACARSVRIEDELARRGIKLNGKVECDGPCPKCGGDDRFSINIKKQIFNCRGCGVGGDVIDLVRHLDGVEFNQACTTLAGEPPKANGKDHHLEVREVCTAEYSYHGEDGTLLFSVRRLEYRNPDGSFVLKDGRRKKSFRQQQPDPNRTGSWISNVTGVPVVPYKLPELIEAVANDHFVVVVEGETKVDFLASWNVPATCNAAGAGKWRSEHSEFLRGANVVILPDNDEPGRDHADSVGASLQGIAKSVRVLELPALGPKQDIIDWAKRYGGTVEELHKLIASEAKPWAASGGGAKQTFQTTKSVEALESAKASSYKMKAVRWVWPTRFGIGKLGVIAGLPDEGKGQILCYIAARITSKTDKGWPCKEGVAPDGNIILLTAEDDPADTVVPRLAAAGADLDRIHIVKMVRNEKGGRRMFSLVTDLELLRRKVVEVGNVIAIQIDPITAYFGCGKMDSFRTTDVRAVLGPLVELAAELGLAVIAIMHFNKKIDITNALVRISDSLAFGATARHVYGVVDDVEKERKLLVRAKNNLSSAASKNKALAYRFSACRVGNDPETGEDIWAPYVIWENQYVEVTATEAMQAAAENRSPGAVDAAKNFLFELLENGAMEKRLVEEAADAKMIVQRTLRRAHDLLKVESAKERKKNGLWFWRLPERGHKWPWEP